MTPRHTTPNRDERAALRHVAIMAIMRAFPSWRASQVASAIGVSRDTVAYHMRAKFKGACLSGPVWQNEIVAACTALANGDCAIAGEKLRAVAAMVDSLRAEKRTA